MPAGISRNTMFLYSALANNIVWGFGLNNRITLEVLAEHFSPLVQLVKFTLLCAVAKRKYRVCRSVMRVAIISLVKS